MNRRIVVGDIEREFKPEAALSLGGRSHLQGYELQ